MHWLGSYVIKEIIDGGAVQLVKLNGEPFPGKMSGSRLKPYTVIQLGDYMREAQA